MSKRINNKKRKHGEYEQKLDPKDEDKYENQDDQFLEDKNKNRKKDKNDMNKNKNKNKNENENVLNSQFYKNIKENRQITDIFKTMVDCLNKKVESLEDEDNINEDNQNFIYLCERLREQFIKIYEKEILEYKLFREKQALTIVKERELYDILKECDKRLVLFRYYQSSCLKTKCDIESQILSIEKKEELNENIYNDDGNESTPENLTTKPSTNNTKTKNTSKASLLTLASKANFNTNFPCNFDRLFSISCERD
ncbi:hypothetical protein ACTFIZ_012063 [Dictyostelium cf. discoideum]